jgi:Uma2 family endonuclease
LFQKTIMRYPAVMNGFAEDNAPVYEPPMSKAAFLHWVQRQERRHELKDGRAIMQAGTTKRHNNICINFIKVLTSTLQPDEWAVQIAEVAVEIGDDIRYPDVLVERFGGDDKDLSTDRPVLLVEVLSPSSVATDMTVKLAEYTQLASLEAYIVASQDEPIVWAWQREAKTRTFPSKPQEFSGRDGVITIDGLSISLPLSELYRGILAR